MNVKKQSFRNKFLPLVLVAVCALGTTQKTAALPWMRVLTLGLYGGEASHAPQQASVAQPTVPYATQAQLAILAGKVEANSRAAAITTAKDMAYIGAAALAGLGLYKLWQKWTDCPSREDLNNTENRLREGQRAHRQALVNARQEFQQGHGAIQRQVEVVRENLSTQQARGFEEAKRERTAMAAKIMADTGVRFDQLQSTLEDPTNGLSAIQTRQSNIERMAKAAATREALEEFQNGMNNQLSTLNNRLNGLQNDTQLILQHVQPNRPLGQAETGDQEPEPTPAPSDVILGNMARNGSPSIIRDRRGDFSPRSMVGQHPSRFTAFRGIWENRGAWASSGFTPALGRGLRLAIITNGFMRG